MEVGARGGQAFRELGVKRRSSCLSADIKSNFDLFINLFKLCCSTSSRG